MYRLVYLGYKWYAKYIESVEDDLENIKIFVEEDDAPILIVSDLQKVSEVLGIDEEEITFPL